MPALVRMTIFVTCIAVLAGCSRERKDWQSAQTADTIEAYGAFLDKHRDSVLATQAQERIRQLGEERDWQQAATADTLEAYQAYLRQHPQSKWAEEARIRVENFSLAGALPAAPAATVTPATPEAPAASRTAPVVEPAPAMQYGVQLGAFTTEARARAEWQRLNRTYGEVLAGLTSSIEAVQSSPGTLYRLRAATPGEAKSRSICEALRARGQACVVVLPVGK